MTAGHCAARGLRSRSPVGGGMGPSCKKPRKTSCRHGPAGSVCGRINILIAHTHTHTHLRCRTAPCLPKAAAKLDFVDVRVHATRSAEQRVARVWGRIHAISTYHHKPTYQRSAANPFGSGIRAVLLSLLRPVGPSCRGRCTPARAIYSVPALHGPVAVHSVSTV